MDLSGLTSAPRRPSSLWAAGLWTACLWTASAWADPDVFFFDGYVVGKNNRTAFASVIRDLERNFGHRVEYGFRDTFQATRKMIYIGEKQFDRWVENELLVAEILRDSPRHSKAGLKVRIEAIGRFVVAHEYFHHLLLHLELYDGIVPAGVELNVSGQKLQETLELQADYLAAAYLILEDLPTRPLEYLISDDYLSPVSMGYTQEQIDSFSDEDWEKFFVPKQGYPRHRNFELHTAAWTLGFRWDLFYNQTVDCRAIVARYPLLMAIQKRLALVNFFDRLQEVIDARTANRANE